MSDGAIALRNDTDSQQLSVVITESQVDLIRRTIAKDASPEELQSFFYDCKRRGVHPLDKLVHFTKRSGKYVPITSIDFMRARAAETGDYAGNDDAVFVDTPKKPNFSATVVVWRFVRDNRCPFGATARWAEYCPASGQDHMWQKMPHVMLAKCAEALALRKAFPQQLSGLYTAEEMDQASGVATTQPIRQPERASAQQATPQSNSNDGPVISEPQRKRLFAIYRGAGHIDVDVREWLRIHYGIEHTKDIARVDYETICARMQSNTPLADDVPPLSEEEPGTNG
jgi:phage recombination protein Bet